MAATAVKFEYPEMCDGAATAVYRDGKYCGLVQRDRHPEGGWTFTALGQYGNFSHAGFRTARDAADIVAAHDANGRPI